MLRNICKYNHVVVDTIRVYVPPNIASLSAGIVPQPMVSSEAQPSVAGFVNFIPLRAMNCFNDQVPRGLPNFYKTSNAMHFYLIGIDNTSSKLIKKCFRVCNVLKDDIIHPNLSGKSAKS